jgi:hypothetical protein
MAVANAAQRGRTVSDPNPAYESIRPLWEKSRAICNGERFVKDFDGFLDIVNFSNLLLPFSPSMTQEQYNFYKSEAELPGIVMQYAKTIVGGLLRKQPHLVLPKDAPADAYNWLMKEFAQDGSPLVTFLDRALWEEMQTSRAWVYVDYPKVDPTKKASMVTSDFQKLKPYPVLWNAESVVNWHMTISSDTGKQILDRVIIRDWELSFAHSEFHPDYLDTVWVHELHEGNYRIRKYQKPTQDSAIAVVNGKLQQQYAVGANGAASSNPQGSSTATTNAFVLVETIENIESNGNRLTEIPAWPLNGCYNPIEPLLTPLIDREVSLYNKMSRRNHLLYGASTYTPVIASDMDDDQFQTVVDSGLGSWLKVRQGDLVTVLDTPTEALKDMEASIAAALEEMAKMGIRMLSPETVQSGVALDIRNASQNAQLGTLNIKVSNIIAQVICFMLNWRYGTTYVVHDIEFCLSADFNPTPLGADWLRLATEWYQNGIIPRTLWLNILKQNDMVPADYDDIEGQKEMNKDPLVMSAPDNMAYEAQVKAEAALSQDGGQSTPPKSKVDKSQA